MSAALMAACSPDYITPDQAKLPQAADFDVRVEVNQETNYVTFNMNNKEIVPVWIIGATDPIDNASGSKVTGKNYAYTGNGLSLRFRDEGKHTVEVKAYNAHGISIGSQMVEFSLNNTYRDPFDPAPYIKALSDGSTKTWEWNHTVAGHFGCGPLGGNGTEWWSAGVDEKKDWSLYDDKITFGADGSYVYDPGDGQVYVNANSGVKSELATGEDYLVPWEKITTTYSVESNWNEAGVEEIYITLPKGTPMSYIADQTELDDPRYLVLENKPADMKKCLKLVATSRQPAILTVSHGITSLSRKVPQAEMSRILSTARPARHGCLTPRLQDTLAVVRISQILRDGGPPVLTRRPDSVSTTTRSPSTLMANTSSTLALTARSTSTRMSQSSAQAQHKARTMTSTGLFKNQHINLMETFLPSLREL